MVGRGGGIQSVGEIIDEVGEGHETLKGNKCFFLALNMKSTF